SYRAPALLLSNGATLSNSPSALNLRVARRHPRRDRPLNTPKRLAAGIYRRGAPHLGRVALAGGIEPPRGLPFAPSFSRGPLDRASILDLRWISTAFPCTRNVRPGS